MVLQACFHGPEEVLEGAWDDILASARLADAIMGTQALLRNPDWALAEFRSAFAACLASRRPEAAHLVRVDLESDLQGGEPATEGNGEE